jgi:hypothetical protein
MEAEEQIIISRRKFIPYRQGSPKNGEVACDVSNSPTQPINFLCK